MREAKEWHVSGGPCLVQSHRDWSLNHVVSEADCHFGLNEKVYEEDVGNRNLANAHLMTWQSCTYAPHHVTS